LRVTPSLRQTGKVLSLQAAHTAPAEPAKQTGVAPEQEVFTSAPFEQLWTLVFESVQICVYELKQALQVPFSQ
jgi:hypothetical protein